MKVYITTAEKDVILTYTKVPIHLVKRIEKSIKISQEKRNFVKRVQVEYSLEELDKILECLAEVSNRSNNFPEVRYVIDNLFGRLAEKHSQGLMDQE